MVVNFRVCEISRDAHKLARTPTLIKKKIPCADKTKQNKRKEKGTALSISKSNTNLEFKSESSKSVDFTSLERVLNSLCMVFINPHVEMIICFITLLLISIP
jgi:hypothetical protein